MNLSSFRYAINGIIDAAKKERNFRIMIVCFALVILANSLLGVSKIEWIITIICASAVLSIELINSAIETTINLVIKENNIEAGNAKDYSAGATLVVSIVAFVVAVLIYMPYIIDLFSGSIT